MTTVAQPQAVVESRTDRTNALPLRRASNQIAGRSSASDVHSNRIRKPVRMGNVMIQLLKQYGITDEEIAQGLEDYAAKHPIAQAS